MRSRCDADDGAAACSCQVLLSSPFPMISPWTSARPQLLSVLTDHAGSYQQVWMGDSRQCRERESSKHIRKHLINDQQQDEEKDQQEGGVADQEVECGVGRGGELIGVIPAAGGGLICGLGRLKTTTFNVILPKGGCGSTALAGGDRGHFGSCFCSGL